MNKSEFARELRRALGKLPSYEVEQSINFYTEAIEDRIEDGMTEHEAVAALGPVDAIAAQIIAETPPIPKAIAKANTGSRTLNIVLLAILSPIWVTLALAFACMVLAIYQARPNTPMGAHRSSMATTAHSATTTDQMAR